MFAGSVSAAYCASRHATTEDATPAKSSLVASVGTARENLRPMEVTCPTCRHVVVVEPGEVQRCGNCGVKVAAPPDSSGVALVADRGALPHVEREESSPTGSSDTPLVIPPVSDTRAATIAAFVLGLLFFIPIVPQVCAVGFSLYALGRRRRPGERVGLAWAGLILGLVALPAWVLIGGTFLASVQTSVAVSRTMVGGTMEEPGDDWGLAGDLGDEMERIHVAARAYRRDFRRWPADVDMLVGRSLSRGFVMSEHLSYRPVPDERSMDLNWILITSDEVVYDLRGDPLAEPHCLVQRLGGKLELLPSAVVEALIGVEDNEPVDLAPIAPSSEDHIDTARPE